MVATVDITAPPGNSGRKVFAGLVRDGRIVARGEAVVPNNGTVQVIIQAMDATPPVPDGEYDLWLTVGRDALESCYPSYGDLFVNQKWDLGTDVAHESAGRSIDLERTHAVQAGEPGHDSLSSLRRGLTTTLRSSWTWDAYFKRSPERNEVFEVGRDTYGSNTATRWWARTGSKGDSDKIGLLPAWRAIGTARIGGDKYLEGRHGQ